LTTAIQNAVRQYVLDTKPEISLDSERLNTAVNMLVQQIISGAQKQNKPSHVIGGMQNDDLLDAEELVIR